MMATHFSLLGLFLFISFLFFVGVSGAYIPERRADENANQKENTDECDTDPKIEWEGNTCTPSHKKVIMEEFQTAIAMTEQTRADLHKHGYDEDFFSPDVREQKDYKDNALETYRRIGEMLKGTSEYKFKVTCDDSAKSCKKTKGQPPLQAYMKDTAKWKQGDKGTMNFCAAFFDDKPQGGQAVIQSTKARISQCEAPDFTIREAQRSRASALIHECVHTRYAMRDDRTKNNIIP